MIAIEKTRVPIPQNRRPPDPRRLYPWLELKIGQSFFVKGTRKRKSLQVQTNHAGKQYKRAFISKTMDGGVRVWRVK